jgi:predicted Zn-dependent protease
MDMTSIIPFISNGVFEPADIKVMSDAYSKAIENIHGFGRPNRIVGKIIATTIIALTQDGERDPDRLCERALTACGFSPERMADIRLAAASVGYAVVVPPANPP